MNWARGRQFLIWSILIAILVAIGSAVAFVIIYKVPSCTDGVQNQDETGVDCGGSCALVCSVDAQAPIVNFVRPLVQTQGRVDVLAYITNRNVSAEAKNAAFTLELYDANNAVVGTVHDTLRIPAGSRNVPLFIPGAYMGTKIVSQAFLMFADGIVWEKATPLPNEQQLSSEYAISQVNGLPVITATFHNPTPQAVRNIKVIIAVFDASNSVIAASQTILKEIPAQGDATGTFTWNTPFSSFPAKVDMLPVYP